MSKLKVRSFNPVWGNRKGNTHYQTMYFSSMLCAMTGQLCVRPPEGIMVKLKAPLHHPPRTHASAKTYPYVLKH